MDSVVKFMYTNSINFIGKKRKPFPTMQKVLFLQRFYNKLRPLLMNIRPSWPDIVRLLLLCLYQVVH